MKCKYCEKVLAGGIYRFKFQLIGNQETLLKKRIYLKEKDYKYWPKENERCGEKTTPT